METAHSQGGQAGRGGDGARGALPLKGIVTASLTPVAADFTIDTERLARHIAGLFAAGCSFVSPFGTTGEGPSFTSAEKIAALKALAERGTPMERLLPASMTPALDDAARMVAAAADLGCRAALLLPPFYYNAAQAGVAAFVDALAGRLGRLPADIVLYNIPSLSRIPYTPELIRRLVDRYGPRIAGIKDSTGSRENAVMLATTFPELSIFTGDDRVLPHLLAAGGAGLIGGMPNIVARDLCEAYRRRGTPDGDALFEKARTRILVVEKHGSPTTLKTLVARHTGDATWARLMPPLLPLAPDAARDAIDAFERTGFAFGRDLP